MYSLNRRLGLGLAASLMLFFVLLSFVISREVVLLSEDNMISRLQHDQEQVLSALTRSPDGEPQLRRKDIPAIYQRPFSGHYFQINMEGQQLRSRSLWDEKLPAPTGVIGRDLPGPKQQRLLMVSRQVQWHGQPVHILVAEDISLIESSTAVFQRHFLLLSAVAILVLLILQNWLVRVSLKPLRKVQEQLVQLDRGVLEQVTAPTPVEIAPLVDEVNRLMRLMRQRLTRSRHSLGDLAHNLKTPLAVARQIVERQVQSENQRSLGAQLDLIGQRIERELVRARTAGPMPGGQWRDVQHDLEDIRQMLKQAFPNVTIELMLDGVTQVSADREDMLEMLGNLLENACKWGHTKVSCMISSSDVGGVQIQVEDDGPGMDGDQIERLLMRGTRADEGFPGYGLGLSIVHTLVQAYEGDIRFSRSPELQGLRVTIAIP